MYLKLLKMWLHVVPCYHRGTVWFGGFNQSRKTFIDGLLRWNTLHNTITVMLYSLPICIWISFPKLYSAPSDLSKSAYREETLLLKGPDVKMSSFAHNSIAVCHHRGLSVVLASSYNVTPPPSQKNSQTLTVFSFHNSDNCESSWRIQIGASLSMNQPHTFEKPAPALRLHCNQSCPPSRPIPSPLTPPRSSSSSSSSSLTGWMASSN